VRVRKQSEAIKRKTKRRKMSALEASKESLGQKEIKAKKTKKKKKKARGGRASIIGPTSLSLSLS
jgi:hypothetical protein